MQPMGVSMRVFQWTAAIALFATIFISNADADDLDRPVSEPTTVRSELLRGQQLASFCSGPSYFDCIEQALKTQLERRTATEPFQLGLYFQGTVTADIVMNVYKSNLAFQACKAITSKAHDLENKLSITDENLFSLFQLNKTAVSDILAARQRCK